MMFHHLDDEVKAAALAEVFRVLRPGGGLHVVDVGGDGPVGLLSRITGHTHEAAGARPPQLMQAAGFDCAAHATRCIRLTGPVTFYRATRPTD